MKGLGKPGTDWSDKCQSMKYLARKSSDGVRRWGTVVVWLGIPSGRLTVVCVRVDGVSLCIMWGPAQQSRAGCPGQAVDFRLMV